MRILNIAVQVVDGGGEAIQCTAVARKVKQLLRILLDSIAPWSLQGEALLPWNLDLGGK